MLTMLRADQLNELFRQQHPCKVSNGGYPLNPKFIVLNFEILNFQVNLRKIISLEPHMKLKSLINEVIFLAEFLIFTCKNYPPPPPWLPPKNC
jgi:hypothetical protein